MNTPVPTPTFLGIGAQRCATTWLYRILQAHPDVFVTEPKEIDFFSYHYQRGLDWYREKFTGSGQARASGEISPSYMEHPLAAVRARACNPDLKLICSLRHPVERAWSNHLFNIREGYLEGDDLSFESVLQDNPMYLERSLYAVALTPWFNAFPREQILVLFQEDIAGDASGEARRVLDFLGVAGDTLSTAETRHNRGDMVRFPGIRKLHRQTARRMERAGLGGITRWVRGTSAWRAFRRSTRLDPDTVVPPMNAATRARLVEAFTPDVIALMRLLEVRTLPWDDWAGVYDAPGA